MFLFRNLPSFDIYLFCDKSENKRKNFFVECNKRNQIRREYLNYIQNQEDNFSLEISSFKKFFSLSNHFIQIN